MRRILYALTPVLFVSCGGTSQLIGAAGGQLCTPDGAICITIPLNGLDDNTSIFISPSKDTPGAALSPTYQIGPDGTLFLKAATVTMKYDLLTEADGGLLINDNSVNPAVLRIYTRELLDGGVYGDWVALDDSVVDRVQSQLIGGTLHLSPFVILRADRLPDGGLAMEGDAGPVKDGGVVICPPPCMSSASCTDMMQNGNETDQDCGGGTCAPCAVGQGCKEGADCTSGRCSMMKCQNPIPDSGTPDSGQPDSGTPDSGTPDSGTPDSGTPDSGVPDSGVPDSGTPDAGRDAGVPDAGIPDAGIDAGVDAGVDAGIDAGVDAGTDAGDPDAGDGG